MDSRMYSRKELDEICKENGITLFDLLENMYRAYLNNKKYEIIEKMLMKDEIFIGKAIIPIEFQNKYAEQLLLFANSRSEKYAKIFRKYSDSEDIASEALMYTLYNKGDIVINSEDEEEAIDRIRGYLNVYIKYRYLEESHINKDISLDADVNQEVKRKRYEVIRSKPIYEERENFETEDLIIQEMQNLYDRGLKNSEILELVMKKYKLKREDLLVILKEELTKRRIIKKTDNNKFYLGEEL